MRPFTIPGYVYRMRLFCHRTLWFLVCASICGSLQAEIPAPTRANKRFVIAAHEWPPFASREARYFGVLPRIVNQVFETQGITVEFRFMPWPDALDGVVSEEFDAALIWVMEDLNRDPFIISAPILEYRSALYYRHTMTPPKKPDDLLGFRIGLNPYYVYDEPSYRIMKSRSMTPVKGDSDRTHFDMLLRGDIDFYLTPVLTSVPLLRNNYSREQQQQLAYTTELFKFPPSHLLLNRQRQGSEQLVLEFNNGLKRLQNDGTLDRYLNDLRFGKY
jgi:polar amino acid transport system substrate-binding protein